MFASAGASFSVPLSSAGSSPPGDWTPDSLESGVVGSSLRKLATSPPQSKAPPKKAARRSASSRAQQAPTAERIREIQSALAKAGFYDGESTGKWDAPTVEAMKRFQESKGLSPSGKIDAKSLQALGLGSEVAGKAPPQPREEVESKP